MIAFTWNILLAIVWVALTASVTAPNFLFGFILGYAAIALVEVKMPSLAGYSRRLPRFVRFLFFYIREMILANAKIAYDVATPNYFMKPGIIALPLEARTDAEIATLANLISLTPGTLSLDVSNDRRVLYIHAMYIEDEEQLMADIKYLEQRVLEVLR